MQKDLGKEELELIEQLNMAAKEKNAGLRGIGGWLMLFQLRIYLGTALSMYLLITYRHDLFYLLAFLIMLAPQIVCLVFFYRRRIVFRAIYMFTTAIGLVSASLISISYLLGVVAGEGIVIYALFSSDRVRNTFS